MPVSKQTPLTSQATHEHNFEQSYADWEASVFDRAAYFAVIELRYGGRGQQRYTKWTVLPWALRYAREHVETGPCVYAVVESGRFTVLDREKWDDWETRWRRSREHIKA
jgi:hypothetical protein